jgi:hypothetical protein
MSETERVTRELEQQISEVMSALAINITSKLKEKTPIDTGWARANWIPSVGEPYDLDISGDDDLDFESSNIASVAGENELINYHIDKGPIFIVNNVPYITFLNEGSSRQAPAGFVQKAIATAIRQTNREVRPRRRRRRR